MSKLYKNFVKHLKENDCTLKRQGKGSHEIWQNPENGKSFTVPTTCKAIPTLKAICKQAGIDLPAFLTKGSRPRANNENTIEDFVPT